MASHLQIQLQILSIFSLSPAYRTNRQASWSPSRLIFPRASISEIRSSPITVPATESTQPYNTNFAESDTNSVFGSNHMPSENGPHSDDLQEERSALREWRRQNAILLEQKDKKEKEVLSQIIEEANEFKVAFHQKRKITCENNITNNREKEKLVLADLEKFHKEADENYWKSISELIPNEVPVIKKRGKKDDDKKPSIVVIKGPKPGKPTDLARMRQILVKLKHNTPDHLKLASKADKVAKAETVALTSEAVVVS